MKNRKMCPKCNSTDITPKTFGKGVDPENVDHINVFDGNTGEGFTVDNAEDIKYIVENI